MTEQRWYMYDMLADDFYMASPQPRFGDIVFGHFTGPPFLAARRDVEALTRS